MKKLLFLLLFVPVLLFAEDASSIDELKGDGYDFEVERSYDLLPFSNGLGSAAYQIKSGNHKLLYLYDHIYKFYDEDTATKNYSRKGIFWGIGDTWLTDAEFVDAEYLDGTGIIKVKKTLGDLAINEYYFMPIESDKRILCAVLEISNTGAPQFVTPYLHLDMSMGGGATTKDETATRYGDLIVESREEGKEGLSLVVLPSEYSYVAYKPDDDFYREFLKTPTPLFGDSVASGKTVQGLFQFEGFMLDSGTVRREMVVIGLAEKDEEEAYIEEVTDWGEYNPQGLIQSEIAVWDEWHSVETLPAGLTTEEERLFRQSTAVLKMGQCREEGSANGQILASLPPGMWNIAWVRDGAYSLVALAESGHLDECKAGLQFMLDAPNGEYEDYVGTEYKISVCRYWGNGDEESDWNNQGPNIEWDNFGLFLWAFSEYVRISEDEEFLNTYYDTVKELVADVLVSLMTDEGYLVPDSSIWERHWEPASPPDGKESFSYSTINAYNGLLSFAEVSDNEEDAAYYTEKANQIKEGFLNNFIDDGVIVSSIEEKSRGIEYYMDASGVEAINFGLVDEDTATATLTAFEDQLGMENSTGFLRNDDGKDYEWSWYDEQEWVVIDLRIAYAYLEMGEFDRAYELISWIVENGIQNYYLIAELLAEDNNGYEGAIPMCGFGAGAYVLDCYRMEEYFDELGLAE